MTDAVEPALENTVRIVAGLTWPIAEADLASLVAALGWTVTSAPGAPRFRADTSLGVNRPTASFSCQDGQLTSITFRVSDVLPEDTPGRADLIGDAFAAAVTAARGVCGSPTRRVRGREPEAAWELPNGGRLTVSAIESSVSVTVHSAEYNQVMHTLSS